MYQANISIYLTNQVDFVKKYKDNLENLKSIASESVPNLTSRGIEILQVTGECSSRLSFIAPNSVLIDLRLPNECQKT